MQQLGPDAKPALSCQWLEEALVESFSIRGLGVLADGWAANLPFPADTAFADAIRLYRDDVLTRYWTVATE